jgi:hypothetical protein
VKGVLNSNLRLWHLVVIGALFALLTGGTIALSAGPAAFWASGSVRLSGAQSDDTVSISGTDNPPVRVLRTTINVPSGKKADIQATFTTELQHNVGTYAYCFGTITLDGAPSNSHNFNPGSYQLLGGGTATEPNAVSVGMIGIRRGVGPGFHAINVYITSAYAGCTLFARGLTVVADIHS